MKQQFLQYIEENPNEYLYSEDGQFHSVDDSPQFPLDKNLFPQFQDEDELVKIQFQLDVEGEEEGEFISHILEIQYDGEEIEGYSIEYIGE